MPFFQNARHFMVNGPDGKTDNEGPPFNGEDVETKVSSALQAVNQRTTQSTFVSGHPTTVIGADSQYLSFSSGSSTFNGQMGQMSGEEKGYLDAELAKMKRQLKEMDERKAQKRANGGRRRGGLVNQGGSGRLLPEVPFTDPVPTIGYLPPPDMSGYPLPPPDMSGGHALPPPDTIGGYALPLHHTLDDFPSLSALPNPDAPNGHQLSSHLLPGQSYQPPQYLHMESTYSHLRNTPVINPPNPSAEDEEADAPGENVSQNIGEPQKLASSPKKKSRLSPRRFTSSLPK